MAKQVSIPYGIDHTKHYTKSIFADFLVETSNDEDKIVIINSDVNLILRQKTLHRKIGLDNIRDYVQNLQRETGEYHNFSDDELFQLIEPKSINTMTDAFEYSRYLKHSSDDVRKRYDKLVADKKAYAEYHKQFYSKKD